MSGAEQTLDDIRAALRSAGLGALEVTAGADGKVQLRGAVATWEQHGDAIDLAFMQGAADVGADLEVAEDEGPAEVAFVPGEHDETSPFVEEATQDAAVYLVRRGDSFWRVAARLLGDGRLHTMLRDANPGVGGLRPGMAIRIPRPDG